MLLVRMAAHRAFLTNSPRMVNDGKVDLLSTGDAPNDCSAHLPDVEPTLPQTAELGREFAFTSHVRGSSPLRLSEGPLTAEHLSLTWLVLYVG